MNKQNSKQSQTQQNKQTTQQREQPAPSLTWVQLSFALDVQTTQQLQAEQRERRVG